MKAPIVLKRSTMEFKTHVFSVPAEPLTNAFLLIFVLVFVAEKLGSLKTQISQKTTKPKYLSKNKTPTGNGSAGVLKRYVPTFRVLSPKNAVDIGLYRGIWGGRLEAACT